MKISGEREQLEIPDRHHRIVRSLWILVIPTCGAPSGLELQTSESNHVLRILMHMVCLYSCCLQTVHAMGIEIMPLDRANINVVNVVPIYWVTTLLCLELWMPQTNKI